MDQKKKMQAQLGSNPPLPTGLGQAAIQQEVIDPTSFDLFIEASSSGSSFFVLGNDRVAAKDHLKKLGGSYNPRKRGYTFPMRELKRVSEFFGIASGLISCNATDTIVVRFEQRFTVEPGQMPTFASALKQLKFTKQRGKGNIWTGDIGQVQAFQSYFNTSPAQ